MKWVICSLEVPLFFKDLPHYHLPLIDIEPVKFNHEDALEKFNHAEALLFSSKNGVYHSCQFLKKIPRDKLAFCVGPSTEKALRALEFSKTYIPKSYDQEGLFELIIDQGIQSICYFRAQEIRPFLKEALKKRGLSLHEIICYKTRQTVIEQPLDFAPLGYFFGSPSQVSSFKKKFVTLPDLPIYVQGHVTKKACQEAFMRLSNIHILSA
jgi:uroporphyrinogen-III synthase